MKTVSNLYDDLVEFPLTATTIRDLIGCLQRGEKVIFDTPIAHLLIACFIKNKQLEREQSAELMKWISDAFQSVLSGTPLDDAFALPRRTRGRPKEIMNIDPIQVAAFIALEERRGQKRDDILADAAQQFSCAIRTLERNCRVNLNSSEYSDIFLKRLVKRKRRRIP